VIYLTGWLPIDPLLSLFISVLIGVASFNVLREVLRVLMEGAPKGVDIAQIKQAMTGVEGVTGVHHVHVWSLSSNRHALSAEIQLDEIGQWESVCPQLQALLRQRFGVDHSTLQPETEESIASDRAHSSDGANPCE